MKILTTMYVVATCLLLLMVSTWYSRPKAEAQQDNKYVGTDTCATCHTDLCKSWALTSHRRTLFGKDPSKSGCEACHGPGGEHVAGGGDKTKIIIPNKLKPQQIAAICLNCHKQEHVTLWATSLHARAKVTCLDCHDLHSPETAMLAKDIDNGTIAIEGLTTEIKKMQLAASSAAVDSEEKTKANDKVAELKAKADALREKIKGTETVYKRVAEPYICYNCHKAQKVQTNMPSHHPIPENKMQCSDCHNPHGGPNGMLKAESINETCFKCHAEKLGPYTFEHEPVSEDCTTCHNPHGAARNNLLIQSEPFLCLKCHAFPHGTSGLNPANAEGTITQRLVRCTVCHSQVHGSNAQRRYFY